MNAKILYLQGSYLKASQETNEVKSICYKIGALVFTGQHDEARLLYKEFEARLDLESLVVARFHLGISFIRTSHYAEARQVFIENLAQSRAGALTSIGSFYVYQGIAFYRFFFSQHSRSQSFARRGYAYLLQNSSPPPLLLALSLDIQGYNLVQLGKIHQGLDAFRKALEVTNKNKLSQLQAEIEISYTVFLSDVDDNISQQILKLRKMLRAVESGNDHSHSELVLQTAKLLLLSGRFSDANTFLNDHFQIIYRNRNRRKIAKLNILMAQLFYWRGQFLEALSIVKIAQENLDQRIDRALHLSTLGLEVKILQQMKQPTAALERMNLIKLGGLERYVNRRIQSRTQKTAAFSFNYGEDRLGDVFDMAYKKERQALEIVLEKNLLLLIPVFFDLPPAQRALIICEPQNRIVTVEIQRISQTKASLSKVQKKILSRLSASGATKQQLVEEIWGYNYEPLRHDPLVYSAIARVRKVLGPHKDWIFSDEDRYSLDSSVRIFFSETRTTSEKSPASHRTENEPTSALNYRQLKTLDTTSDFMSVSEYGKRWKVTRMTALRDLRELCALGHMKKTGQGKATRYKST